jgi:hypothetical protein
MARDISGAVPAADRIQSVVRDGVQVLVGVHAGLAVTGFSLRRVFQVVH